MANDAALLNELLADEPSGNGTSTRGSSITMSRSAPLYAPAPPQDQHTTLGASLAASSEAALQHGDAPPYVWWVVIAVAVALALLVLVLGMGIGHRRVEVHAPPTMHNGPTRIALEIPDAHGSMPELRVYIDGRSEEGTLLFSWTRDGTAPLCGFTRPALLEWLSANYVPDGSHVDSGHFLCIALSGEYAPRQAGGSVQQVGLYLSPYGLLVAEPGIKFKIDIGVVDGSAESIWDVGTANENGLIGGRQGRRIANVYWTQATGRQAPQTVPWPFSGGDRKGHSDFDPVWEYARNGVSLQFLTNGDLRLTTTDTSGTAVDRFHAATDVRSGLSDQTIHLCA